MDSLEVLSVCQEYNQRALATGQIWNRFTPFGLKTDIEKVTTRENNERWLNLCLSGQSCPAVKTDMIEE